MFPMPMPEMPQDIMDAVAANPEGFAEAMGQGMEAFNGAMGDGGDIGAAFEIIVFSSDCLSDCKTFFDRENTAFK